MTPSISVVVINYNYERFLSEAIESVLAQSKRAHEMIVVDDCSSDGSPALIEKYRAAGSITAVLRPQNGGQWAGMRDGVAAASGDYIAFLDADDLWTEHYLKEVASALSEVPHCDYFFTGYEHFGESSGTAMSSPDGALVEYGPTKLLNWFSPGWLSAPTSACLVRRTHAEQILALNLDREWRICADNGVQLMSSLMGGEKCHLPKPLMRYRKHGGNLWNQSEKSDKIKYVELDAVARTMGECGATLQRGLPSLIERAFLSRTVSDTLLKNLVVEASLGDKTPKLLKGYYRALRNLRSSSWSRRRKYQGEIKALMEVKS